MVEGLFDSKILITSQTPVCLIYYVSLCNNYSILVSNKFLFCSFPLLGFQYHDFYSSLLSPPTL